MTADPTRHLKPVHLRHFQVEKDQIRKRMLAAIGKLALAAQIANRLDPALHATEPGELSKPFP
jgi:hypothetical protein